MVAQNIRLPNIKKMFIPDPGNTIVDADLAGADAQVVAWEAGDEKLKTAFRKGLKIHIVNAREVWPEETKDMTDEELKNTGKSGGKYYQIKRAVHGTNYNGQPDSLVATLGWSRKQAEEFQEKWFYLHPEIKKWHERTQRHLDGTECWNCHNRDVYLNKPCPKCGSHLGRTIKNQFGFRRIWLDRVSVPMLNEALAWGPQSTVAFCTDLGWTNIVHGNTYELTMNRKTTHQDWSNLLVEPNAKEKWGYIFDPLLQVHDSCVFQLPSSEESSVEQIVYDMRVRIPYKDPLIIPMSYGMSRHSWGDI